MVNLHGLEALTHHRRIQVIHGLELSTQRRIQVDGVPIDATNETFTQSDVDALNPHGDHRGLQTTDAYAKHDGPNGTKHNVNGSIAVGRIAERYVYNVLIGLGLKVTKPNFKKDKHREADMRIITTYGYIDVEVKSNPAQFAHERGYVVQASLAPTKTQGTPWINGILRKNESQRGGFELFFCVKVMVSRENGQKVYTCSPDTVFGVFARDICFSDPNDPGRLGLKITIRSDQNCTGKILVPNLVETGKETVEQRQFILNFRNPLLMNSPFPLKMMLSKKLRGMTDGQRCGEYYQTTDSTKFFTYVNTNQYKRQFPFNCLNRIAQKQHGHARRTRATTAVCRESTSKETVTDCNTHKPANAWVKPLQFKQEQKKDTRSVCCNAASAS